MSHISSSDHSCKCDDRSLESQCKCNGVSKCNCVSRCHSVPECIEQYLKPIAYDDLFDEKINRCTDYNLIVKKLNEARMSFFSFHTAICNFIGDCSGLKQKARDDISGSDLISLKYDYQGLLHTLIRSVALNMRKKIKDDNYVLVNFEVPATRIGKNIYSTSNLLPTDIVFTDSGGVDTLVISIPTVTLYLCSDYQLQVKISSPRGVSYSNISYENTYIKQYRPIENDIFVKNMTPSLTSVGDDYEFVSAEHANEIFDDIINYSTDDNITTHQLRDVSERINGIIRCIENAHRTIIQKIKTEKLALQSAGKR